MKKQIQHTDRYAAPQLLVTVFEDTDLLRTSGEGDRVIELDEIEIFGGQFSSGRE